MNHTLALKALLFMNFGENMFVDYATQHCFSVNTGSNVGRCNRVYNIPGITDEEVMAIQNYFGTTPFTWVLNANDSDTREILEKHELSHKASSVGMYLNLPQLKGNEIASNPTIYIQEVACEEDFLTWISIVSASYGHGNFHVELAEAIRFLIKRAPAGTLKLYLGYYDNTPVSSNMTIYHTNQIISIHLVGTLAEYRKKGIGYATIYQSLIIARNHGYIAAILMASPTGLSLAQKLGFEEYTQYLIFGN